MSEISAHDMSLSENAVINHSIKDPSVLVGWRIIVKDHGHGIVAHMLKRKFTTTIFVCEFDNGKTEILALQRSVKKGNVPFVLVSKTK